MLLLVCYRTLAATTEPRRAYIDFTACTHHSHVVAEVPSIVAVGSPTASLHPLLHCPRSGGTVVAAHAQAHRLRNP